MPKPEIIRVTFVPPKPFDILEYIKEQGLEVIQDNEVLPVQLEGNVPMSFAPFLRDGESYVNGDTMCQRAKEMGNPGGLRAGGVVYEQYQRLSSEEKEALNGLYTVFTATVLRYQGGRRAVVSLRCYGGECDLQFRCLDSRFGASGRVALLESK